MAYLRSLTGIGSTLVLAACVTINVYFPAAAAEKAADRIIDDVWGTSGAQGAPPPAAPVGEAPDKRSSLPARILDFLIPAAEAAAPNIDISSPAIAKIQGSMKARHGQLAPFYDSGAVGLTSDGRVAVRDPGAVPLRDRNQVNRLVADENRDRDALYREIAQGNGHPEWEAQIRQTFARRWVSNARPGWWHQDAGAWKQR